MLRVRNIGLCLLLCFQCILHNGLALGGKAQEGHAVGVEVLLDEDIGWKCENGSDCTVAATSCVNGTCQCPAGQIYNGAMTTCIKVATTYGDSCEESAQCSRYLFSGGICTNGICVCAKGYYYMHGRCIAYSGLFGKCHKDDDCYVNGDFEATSCDQKNKICKCSPGYYQREYRTCRPEAKLGEKCAIDNDCTRFKKDAYCNIDNTCVLLISNSTLNFLHNDDTLREADASKPVAVTILSNCTVDTDCENFGNATCGPLGTCICKRAYFFVQNVNKCVPELGEPCVAGKEDAVIEYSTCQNGRWNCEHYRAATTDNRECVKAIRRYNDFCRSDMQCYIFGPDAICKGNKCVCNENSRYNETELFCWTKRGVGETCQQDTDCYVDGMQAELSCVNKSCSCPEGTHPNINRTACVNTAAEIGERCEVDKDCVTKDAECINEICACVNNYYELNKKCVPGINANCTRDEDCDPENSKCESNRCTCKQDYVAPSITICLPVVSIGEPCEEDIQCSNRTLNAVCSRDNMTMADSISNSTCVCAIGYHYNYNKCFKRKVLGMECESLGECYLDYGHGVVCKNSWCACDSGYIQVNDTVCESTRRSNNNTGSAITSTMGLILVLLLLLNF
ncbi:PREDICTED: cell death abnormality protein 1-like [Eufriesea mexicana]|uniref:cell death abnormality protein 1-like n=1 Tax=Eufriesea mexicana TaxID=516756 RepID=UPI00083BCE4F|nr:PREDICTED: cell death abnormality protein 1-like [Eufriesea mexicana]